MTDRSPASIESWHAHVYFDAESRDAAKAFRDVVGWLALNHAGLDVFLHPNTGDELRDHRDSAVWIGRSHALDLRAVGG
jgi:DOPA 4,5-dioxygenase